MGAHHGAVEELDQMRRPTMPGEQLEEDLEDACATKAPKALPDAVPPAELRRQRAPGNVVPREVMNHLQEFPRAGARPGGTCAASNTASVTSQSWSVICVSINPFSIPITYLFDKMPIRGIAQIFIAGIPSTRPGMTRVGLESGPLSAWHWHELRKLGLPIVCLDARHTKAALSLQMNRSDRNDARGLVQIVRTGWSREVAVKNVNTRLIRTLLATHAQLDLELHRWPACGRSGCALCV